MSDPLAAYWKLRLQAVAERLKRNHFQVHVVQTAQEAGRLVRDTIVEQVAPASISWGGSLTALAADLYHPFLDDDRFEVIDTLDRSLPAEQMLQRRRQALLCDLFITGTNAVTEDGRLVNLDMIGNRVAALTFGPRAVVVVAGRNKVVADLDAAMARIKSLAAPANAIRLEMDTPCRKTGRCVSCNSPARICNAWAITEKSFPKDRIKVVLVNEDLGL